MCGGFTCSKNTLIGLNMIYIMVAFLLIGVGTYAKTAAIVTNLPTVGGIVASGVFLLFISIVGLVGAIKHHQVLLFFYMVVLFGIFLIQFSVACACLAVDKDQELIIAEKAWNKSSDDLKFSAEKFFECCGFSDATSEGVRCGEIPACQGNNNKTTCSPCKESLQEKIDDGFNASGGVGLFFAFTEFVAVIYALRVRKQLREQSEIA